MLSICVLMGLQLVVSVCLVYILCCVMFQYFVWVVAVFVRCKANLKNICFQWSARVTGNSLFQLNFFFKNEGYFLTKRKGKKYSTRQICSSPPGFNVGRLLDRKHIFF